MFDISGEKYEELRLILEKQNGRAYTFEEAKEIGDELVGFFILLNDISDEGRAENSELSNSKTSWLGCVHYA